MTKIFLFIFIIFSMGCNKTASLKINASNDIKPSIYQAISDVDNCFKANNIPSCDLKKGGTLTVIKKPFEKMVNGYPCFKYGGQWVAGLAEGYCGSKSCKITVGIDKNGKWNINVLKHEICHFFDFKCNKCIGGNDGHPPIYVSCCPSWRGKSKTIIKRSIDGDKIIDIIYP